MAITYAERVKRNWQNNKKFNLNKLIDYFVNLNVADTSKSVYISKFKTELKKIRDDPMLEKIKLPETMAQKVWDEPQKKHEERKT
jgi:hypothetical protein